MGKAPKVFRKCIARCAIAARFLAVCATEA